MTRTFLLAAAALGLAACAGTPDADEIATAEGGSGKTCKYENTTGSRTAVKTCRTAEEWAAAARRAAAPSSVTAARNTTQLPSHAPGTGPSGGRQ